MIKDPPYFLYFLDKGGNKKGAKKSAIILLLGLTRRRTAKTEQMEQQGVRRKHTNQLVKLLFYCNNIEYKFLLDGEFMLGAKNSDEDFSYQHETLSAWVSTVFTSNEQT